MDAIARTIRRAFPRVPVVRINVTPCSCADCHALRDALGGHDYTTVDAEEIDRHPDALSLFTGDAYRAFLPAYMLRALGDVAASRRHVLEDVVYELLPEGEADERFRDRHWDLTLPQVEAVWEFLRFAYSVDQELFATDRLDGRIVIPQGHLGRSLVGDDVPDSLRYWHQRLLGSFT